MQQTAVDHGVPRVAAKVHFAAAWAVLLRDLPALAIFTLLGLLMLAPILSAPDIQVLGHPGDQVAYAYMAGHIAEALTQLRSPFVDSRLDGLLLGSTEFPYLTLFGVVPATLLGGPTLGYNAALLLANLLTAYFTYLWVLKLTDSRIGAVVAGLAFMLAPFRFARSFGHLSLASTFTLPLFFWALQSTLGPRPPTPRSLLLLGGAALLVAGVSQYLALIVCLTGVAYALLALRSRPRFLLRHGLWPALAVAAGVVLGVVPSLQALAQGGMTAYTIEQTRIWSASPVNFIAPSPFHPLWGHWIQQVRPETLWIEKALYIGAVALVLALIALWRAQDELRYTCVTWAGVVLASALFALGTDLHFGNTPLRQSDPFWLPMYYLGQLPLVDMARTWSRFGVITVLFVALLAGVGTALLARGRYRHLIGAALLALLIVDLLPGAPPVSQVRPRPVDYWLAAQPGDFAVGFLPVEHGLPSYRVAYGSLVHGKRTFAAMHNQHFSTAFDAFARAAADFPSPTSIAALRAAGMRYLVLEPDLYGDRWPEVEAAVRASPELEALGRMGREYVVRLR